MTLPARHPHPGDTVPPGSACSRFPRFPFFVMAVLFLTAAFMRPAAAQGPRALQSLTDGKELFLAGCAGCHGPDGAGMPDSTVGFEKPATFPDFSQCDQSSPEFESGWRAVIHDGGPVRGFSPIMPAFGDLLTPAQIDALVKHVRSLCGDRAWPPGELNLPRPLNVEKAFPENETVVTSSIGARRVHDMTNTIAYERRYGARGQLEVSVPFSVVHEASATARGIGDIGVGFKRVLLSTMRTGSIASVQGEVVLPTGNTEKGLGSGVTVFEGFGAFGQLLPSAGFIQGQAGAEFPTDTRDNPRAVFARIAVGKMLRAGSGRGRMWAPVLELLGDREFEPGAATNIDIVPQFQVTLSRRQHVRANVGLQVPVNHKDGRPVQVQMYLLWDWFDGGFLEGWK
jgi:mono/diheme cytochrome c family protein